MAPSIVDDIGEARLVVDDRTLAFRHCGWASPKACPTLGKACVLTPPTSVVALRHGFDPDLHPSSRRLIDRVVHATDSAVIDARTPPNCVIESREEAPVAYVCDAELGELTEGGAWGP